MNYNKTILLSAAFIVGSFLAKGDIGELTGKYWFDESNTTISFTPESHLDIPTDGLSDGLHTLHMYVEKDSITSSVSSRWFFKCKSFASASNAQLHLSVDGKALENVTGTPSGDVMALDLDMSQISEGIHRLEAFVEIDGSISVPAARWFVKTLETKAGEKYRVNFFIDGRSYQGIETTATTNGIISLDVDMTPLSYGLHTLQAQLISPTGITSGTASTLFMRIPTDAQLASLHGYYVIDNRIGGEVESSADGTTYNFNIDTSTLVSGLHNISIYLAESDGLVTSIKTAWFIKTPQGGDGIKSYEYWLNDNTDNAKTVALESTANPFCLISLIDVDEEPFRSTSYTFALDGGKPQAYAKNEFNIRFYDPEGRTATDKCEYTDMRVKHEISTVTQLTESKQYTLDELPDNDIRWHSFDAVEGDSIELYLDRKAMYEIYDCEANLIMSASGDESTSSKVVKITKTGKHYIAVHDIISNNKSGMKLIFTLYVNTEIGSVGSVIADESDEVKYYDLQGRPVDIESAKGVVIDSKGRKIIVK